MFCRRNRNWTQNNADVFCPQEEEQKRRGEERRGEQEGDGARPRGTGGTGWVRT